MNAVYKYKDGIIVRADSKENADIKHREIKKSIEENINVRGELVNENRSND